MLDANGSGLVGRDGLGDTLERHVGARDRTGAVGNGVGHGFDMAVHRIIKNQYLCHRAFS
ncbi:hypothetical protein D3C86_1802390 [compost metagenome]